MSGISEDREMSPDELLTSYEETAHYPRLAVERARAERSAGATPLNVDREIVAAWMIDHGFTTGHGNTTTDLLAELDWQLIERNAAPNVVDLNAEVLRVLQFANHAWGMTLPTDLMTINQLRAALHSGDYKLVRR